MLFATAFVVAPGRNTHLNYVHTQHRHTFFCSPCSRDSTAALHFCISSFSRLGTCTKCLLLIYNTASGLTFNTGFSFSSIVTEENNLKYILIDYVDGMHEYVFYSVSIRSFMEGRGFLTASLVSKDSTTGPAGYIQYNTNDMHLGERRPH